MISVVSADHPTFITTDLQLAGQNSNDRSGASHSLQSPTRRFRVTPGKAKHAPHCCSEADGVPRTRQLSWCKEHLPFQTPSEGGIYCSLMEIRGLGERRTLDRMGYDLAPNVNRLTRLDSRVTEDETFQRNVAASQTVRMAYRTLVGTVGT